MSHTNILTCSIIYILYFHHFRVYSAPEKVTVAICRCFAVLQSPERRKSRWARHPLPSSMFLHCYLPMWHLETTLRIPIHLYLCNRTVGTAAERDAADGNAKMLQHVRVSCKFLPEWEFIRKVSLCKSSVPTFWYLCAIVCHQRQNTALGEPFLLTDMVSLWTFSTGVVWLKKIKQERLWIQILTYTD